MLPPPTTLKDFRAAVLSHPPRRIALVQDDGQMLTYEGLTSAVGTMVQRLGSRRSLVMIEGTNTIDAVVAYLASVLHGHVAMMVAPGQPAERSRMIEQYRPQWLHAADAHRPGLQQIGEDGVRLGRDLSLMLSTSGSTGTSKFVRLSFQNTLSNATSIAEYLGLNADDRALANLPLHYSYGLSILNSNLVAGAAVLLTDKSFANGQMWEFFEQQRGTSLAGVPHSYELLDAIRFETKPLPSLRLLTQAGGRLAREKVLRYASLARNRGWKFFVMYGQTEAAPRMAYLPPELAAEYPDCIGRAIPGGQFSLRRTDGSVIDSVDEEGELIYRGPNVMLGYAESAADLSAEGALQELVTGDLACCNLAGLYRITGRKSRFLKLFGSRVSLDELERRLEGAGFSVVCGGNDQRLVVLTNSRGSLSAIATFVINQCRLPEHVVLVREVDDYPTLLSGKIDYREMDVMAPEPLTNRHRPDNTPLRRDTLSTRVARVFGARRSGVTVRSIYQNLFPTKSVTEDDSFASLGGDSLTYVEASMDLSKLFGQLPDQWEKYTVRQLEGTVAGRQRISYVETETVLRCLAMVAIVGGHFKLFTGLSGSPALLMLLVGFNFAKFQVTEIIKRETVRPLLVMVTRMAVPTIAVLSVLQLKLSEFSALQLMLLGNWLGPSRFKFEFWFIEMLIQTLLVLALLLSFKFVRSTYQRAPVRFTSTLLAITVGVAQFAPPLFSTEHLFNRVPHMFLWLLVLGWVLHVLLVQSKKGLAILVLTIASIVAVIGWAAAAGDGVSGPALWVWFGGITLILVAKVPIPRPVDRGVYMIAGASLFIFLVHFSARNVGHRLGLPATPWLDTAVGLLGGVVAWLLWEHMTRFVLRRASQHAPKP